MVWHSGGDGAVEVTLPKNKLSIIYLHFLTLPSLVSLHPFKQVYSV